MSGLVVAPANLVFRFIVGSCLCGVNASYMYNGKQVRVCTAL